LCDNLKSVTISTGMQMPIGLIVHGGAGDIEEHEHEQRLEAVRAAVEAAWGPLQQGATALDVVELAVREMEANPILNCGYGSCLNRDGVVELDALIMDGRHRIGAVAAVQRVKHPVSLARYVMERTTHHLLAGPGAEQFAAEQNFPMVDPASLISEPRLKKQAASRRDTVGAVALDSAGTVAVAVSTGGIDGKLPGRVGDSPIAGAGGYADNELGAACATGVGEGIIRSLLTFRAVEALRSVDNPQAAANEVLAMFTDRFSGDGGFILIDRHGGIGIAHNTRYMPVAYISDDHIVARLSSHEQ
jgi:L-asparaginase / beta-aspartyl-peptidase